MNTNQDLTWKAMCELGDYFSRLGGAARPFNMAESEIQLYIGYRLLSINDDPVHVTEFENQEFLKAAEPVIEKTNAYLAEVQLAGLVVHPLAKR